MMTRKYNTNLFTFSLLFVVSLFFLAGYLKIGVSVSDLRVFGGDQYYQRASLYRQGLFYIFCVLSPAVLAMAWALSQFRRIRFLVEKMVMYFKRTPEWVFWALIPCVSIALNVLTAKYVIGGVPRVFDSYNYWFQAKNFSLGMFYASVPPLPDLFAFPFVVMRHGKWFGSVYPGFPLVLSLGVLVDMGWLVNPILGGLSLSVLYCLTRNMLGRSTAALVVVLGMLSPFQRMMSSIFMSHACAMLWVSIAMLSFWKWGSARSRVRNYYPFIAGVALGLIYITRPQAGAVTLPALFIWVLYRVRWCGWRRLFLFVAPLLVAIVFLAIYNYQLTGDPLVNPRYFVDPGRSLGFGESLGVPLADGLRSGHDWVRGLKNAETLLNLLTAELSGWGAWSVFGWFTLLWSVVLIRRYKNPVTWILSASLFLNLTLYIFYFTPSPNFGPRYLSESLPAALILLGFGITEIWSIGKLRCDGILRSVVVLSFAFLTIISTLIFLPMHINHYGILPDVLEKSALPDLPDNSVILIPQNLYCMNSFTWNSPDLNGNIFLPLRGEGVTRKICDAFSERSLYTLTPGDETSKKYGIISYPCPEEEHVDIEVK